MCMHWAVAHKMAVTFCITSHAPDSNYPHAQFILSSWDHIELPEQYNTPEKLGIDAVVFSPDPDGLPNIKFGYDAPNNVNRQIISTQAGLHLVTTRYVLKLRIDSFLNHARFLAHYQHYTAQIQAHLPAAPTRLSYTPIVVPHFFTIDPNVFENMAFHISDWSQFGETVTLKAYWSAQLMSKADAPILNAMPMKPTMHLQTMRFARDSQSSSISPLNMHAHWATVYPRNIITLPLKFYVPIVIFWHHTLLCLIWQILV